MMDRRTQMKGKVDQLAGAGPPCLPKSNNRSRLLGLKAYLAWVVDVPHVSSSGAPGPTRCLDRGGLPAPRPVEYLCISWQQYSRQEQIESNRIAKWGIDQTKNREKRRRSVHRLDARALRGYNVPTACAWHRAAAWMLAGACAVEAWRACVAPIDPPAGPL